MIRTRQNSARDTMNMGRLPRLVLGSVIAAITATGCQDAQGPTDPLETPPPLDALIVSNPGLTSSIQGGGPARSSSAVGLVYVSLPSGSFPNGDSILIQTRHSGSRTTAVFLNGGIDPVAVAASAGDTLEIRVYLDGPVGALDFLSLVPAHRPPVLVRTDPRPGRRDVPLNAVIVLVFSEPIKAATLTAAAVQLSSGGQAVPGTLAFADPAHLIVMLTPNALLTPGADYTVLVTEAVTDLTGDPLGAPVSFGFETLPGTPTAASFTYTCAGLSCQFTNQSVIGDGAGSLTAYDWDFGDNGAHGSARDASHTYAAPGGQFTVTLTVTDDLARMSTATRQVKVTPANSPPAASFTVSCAALACTFSNTSSDADGTIDQYDWDFGDNSAHGSTRDATHTYAAPGGLFTVTLTVTDDDDQTASATTQVNASTTNIPPTASFTVSCAYLICIFDNTSTDPDGAIIAYDWNFGDNTPHVTVRQTTHIYASPGGQFTVTLMVTDDDGQTAISTMPLTVSDAFPPPPDPRDNLPTASFQVSCLGLTCNFYDHSSDVGGLIVSHAWSFGDGQTSSAPNPQHTYAIPGTYTIQLTVTDNAGNRASASQTATVPPPTISFTYSCSGPVCDFQTPGTPFDDFFWDFGDGQRSTLQNPTHVYNVTQPTTFTVVLSKWDSQTGGGITYQNITVGP